MSEVFYSMPIYIYMENMRFHYIQKWWFYLNKSLSFQTSKYFSHISITPVEYVILLSIKIICIDKWHTKEWVIGANTRAKQKSWLFIYTVIDTYDKSFFFAKSCCNRINKIYIAFVFVYVWIYWVSDMSLST